MRARGSPRWLVVGVCLAAGALTPAAAQAHTAHRLTIRLPLPAAGDASVAVVKVKVPAGVNVTTALRKVTVHIGRRPKGVGTILAAAKFKRGQALIIVELLRPKPSATTRATAHAAAGGPISMTVEGPAETLSVDRIADDVVARGTNAGLNEWDFCTSIDRADWVKSVILDQPFALERLPPDTTVDQLTQAVLEELCGDYTAGDLVRAYLGLPPRPTGPSLCATVMSLLNDPGPEFLFRLTCSAPVTQLQFTFTGQTVVAYKSATGAVCTPSGPTLTCVGTYPANQPISIQALTNTRALCNAALTLTATSAGKVDPLTFKPCSQ